VSLLQGLLDNLAKTVRFSVIATNSGFMLVVVALPLVSTARFVKIIYGCTQHILSSYSEEGAALIISSIVESAKNRIRHLSMNKGSRKINSKLSTPVLRQTTPTEGKGILTNSSSSSRSAVKCERTHPETTSFSTGNVLSDKSQHNTSHSCTFDDNSSSLSATGVSDRSHRYLLQMTFQSLKLSYKKQPISWYSGQTGKVW